MSGHKSDVIRMNAQDAFLHNGVTKNDFHRWHIGSKVKGEYMMATPKILVVGSFVMDQIATTDVIPREGQTVLGKSFHKAPGGKGANQAVQAARLGADVSIVGKIGCDSNGEEMIRVCREAGIDVSRVLYDENSTSGCAVIILQEKENEPTQNRILVIPGTNMMIRADEIDFLKHEVGNYDMVILQNEIPMEINVLTAKYAYEAGVPVMLNSAPSALLPEELYRYLTFISPNETEIEDMTGVHIPHVDNAVDRVAARRAAEILRNKGVKNVLITLGSAGALLLNDEGEFYSPCAENVTVADPTAAGDSFVGAFCTGACCGWDWKTILVFANHTAAVTVSKIGAMPSLPTIEQVLKCLEERNIVAPKVSILHRS